MFIKEEKDRLKLSLRSKGKFAVNDFATAHFSGGGHLNAAGGESFLTMDETVRKFEDILQNHYKEELAAMMAE